MYFPLINLGVIIGRFYFVFSNKFNQVNYANQMIAIRPHLHIMCKML
jgi:hypothetical protein